MAANVFGTPITALNLAGKQEHNSSDGSNQSYRAKLGIQKKNAEQKDVEARNFVKQLRDDKFQKDSLGGTMCLVYNATGNSVTLYHAKYWEGRASESHCRLIISNGQWGAFLIAPNTENTTAAAFIYQGLDCVGQQVHWVTAFTTDSNTKNKIIAEVRPPSHYSYDDYSSKWNDLKKRLFKGRDDQGIDEDMEGSSIMYASIGGSESPMVEVIITVSGALDD